MKEIGQLFQAIIILIIGIVLFGALGMTALANQIGSLSVLIIIVAIIVIIARVILKIIENSSNYFDF